MVLLKEPCYLASANLYGLLLVRAVTLSIGPSNHHRIGDFDFKHWDIINEMYIFL